jgi:trehalose 6-phosphate synthase
VLSENTGAHEELAGCVLSVNPFDVQQQADAIHTALTASPEEREHRMSRLREIIAARSPADWIDEQLADIERKQRDRGSPVTRPSGRGS